MVENIGPETYWSETLESILSMYKMPKEKRKAMGKQGKAYCNANFEREMLIDKLEGLMRECVQQKNNWELKS